MSVSEPGVSHTPSPQRARLTLRREIVLAFLPALTIVGSLAFFDALVRQRLLLASLSASAFLVYLEPRHPMNSVRTVLLAQMAAAAAGAIAFAIFGATFAASGVAVVVTIGAMITPDAMHQPAVSTTFGFVMRAAQAQVPVLIALVAVVTVLIIMLHQTAEWMLRHFDRLDEE